MRILWIYKYDHAYNMDFWLHEGFMRACNNDEVQSFIYGPRMHEIAENNCLVKYDKNHTVKDLEEIFKPDLIICNTKSRMFDYYSPPSRGNRAEGCILPNDFKDSKIPKILLDEDSHYEINDDWVHEMGFNLTLQRHKSQVDRKWKVKTKWLPFSVDISIFRTANLNRVNKICFVGSMTGPYPDRIFATKVLSEAGLIDIYSQRQKIGNEYVKNLQEYVSHLSGASQYDITAAKNFEIMASGSVLFTNEFTGLRDLFPSDSYILWNENNIIEKAKEIINNKDYANYITENAVKVIKHNHSHEQRLIELCEIVKKEL